MKMIILGPPGAGKGTQAEILKEKLGVPAISTGVMLRSAIREGTEVGKIAENFINEGKLVPDDVIVRIVSERLAKPDCSNGFILDGFPRTTAQAEALDKSDVEIDRVLSLEVEDEVIVKRLSGRRECEACGTPYHVEFKPSPDGELCPCGGKLIQRHDDNEETIRQRIEIYHDQTEPIKDFYKAKNLLVAVVGRSEIADTTRAVCEALGIEA